jgi:hypothetical protein
MVLKVTMNYHEEGEHTCETFSCIADKIVHKRIYYKSLLDLQKKYDELTNDIDGCIMAMPDFWDTNKQKEDEKDPKPGYFIFCTFENKDGVREFIAFKDARLYGTHKGHTFDTA